MSLGGNNYVTAGNFLWRISEGKFTNNLYVLSQTVAKAAKTTEVATELENPLPDFTAKQDPSMGLISATGNYQQ